MLDRHVTKLKVCKSATGLTEGQGRSSNDIMVDLFKRYKADTETKIKQYISQKFKDYDEVGHIDKDCLMVLGTSTRT